jgi:hypothetical protein
VTQTPTATPPAIVDLSSLAWVNVPDQAPDSQDTCGNTVTYGPDNLVDGKTATAWRVKGDGQDVWIELSFGREVMITSLAILPGYDKRDPCDQSIYWCPKNRIPKRLRLLTSSGEQTDLALDNACAWQTFDIGPRRTRSLRVTILDSYPRQEDFPIEYTTISEVRVSGWEF